VEGPRAFEDVLMEWRESRLPKALLYEGEASMDLKTLLRRTPPEKGIAMVVGPEGGFTPGEVDAAQAAGFVPVSLGRRILRAETAGMAVVTVVQYEWGDLGIENASRKTKG
jgi:16S rRNA (uracil1498-N3)-methyltransferase